MLKEDVKTLLTLQDIDLKIFNLQKQIEEKPRLIKQKEDALKKFHQNADSKNQAIKSIKVQIERKNLDLRDSEEKIKKLTSQLNIVKTNKEYAALVSEINNLKADKSLIEDEILQLMSSTDSIEKEIKAIKSNLEKEIDEFNEFKNKIENEEKLLRKDVEKLIAERKTITEKIDKITLDVYTRIMNNKNDKVAMSNADNGVCSSCFISLTTQDINMILKCKELVFCRSCSRILFISEEAAINLKK